MVVLVDVNEARDHARVVLDVGEIFPSKPAGDVLLGQDDLFQPCLEDNLRAPLFCLGGLAAIVIIPDLRLLFPNRWQSLDISYVSLVRRHQ